VLAQGAQPWWDFYGGKERITVVDLLPEPPVAR
jgi:hypothetical protein